MDAMVDSVLDADPACLSHDERLELLEAIEHTRAALDAQQQRTLALLAADGDALARSKEWVREEVACVLRLAPVTAGARLHDALELVQRLPRTLDRLVEGAITMPHARTLVEHVRVLDDDTTSKVETRVLHRAGEQTIGDFRRSVKRAVHTLDPRGAEQQHDAAVAERRVVAYPAEHGMTDVFAHLPADDAAQLMTTLDTHAAQLDDPADERTTDQKRADVLTGLAELAAAGMNTTWQGRRPTIQVSVALSTLLGLDDQPAELHGHGPVPASLARRIAADPSGTWRRIITDPNGRLLDYGHTTYRPPADLRDHVIAHDHTCRFPGCRRQAQRCHLDHTQPYEAGGTTSPDNLECLCTRHHLMKHHAGWQPLRKHHTTQWTSPTGRHYNTPHHRHPTDHTTEPAPF